MPPTGGSLTHGGSTSVRGRVRSPNVAGSLPIAEVSCALRVGTDGRIAVSLNASQRRGYSNQFISSRPLSNFAENMALRVAA